MLQKPRQTVLISGYYGFGNCGDEAVLAGIMEQLTSLWPQADYIVLSGDPVRTAREHGVKAIHRHDIKGLLTALRASTVFVSGGGTLLQDVTSSRSLYYYLFMILVARWYRLPVIIYGQGIGPFRCRPNRRLALGVLRLAHLVIVRDRGAYSQLLAWGFDERKLHLGADPVLALKPVAHTLDKDEFHSMLETGKPALFVSLRPWPQVSLNLSAVARALDYMCQKGWQVVFIPFQFEADYPVCQACAELMQESALVWSTPLAAKDMLAVFGEADYCLGMRLHALVFSAVHKIPMLGLAYDPKVSEFMRELRLEELVVALPDVRDEPLDPEDLIKCLELLEAERQRLVAQIGEKADKMAARLVTATRLMGGEVAKH
jgi:polysaccharide pyruvyl transferase CsaB